MYFLISFLLINIIKKYIILIIKKARKEYNVTVTRYVEKVKREEIGERGEMNAGTIEDSGYHHYYFENIRLLARDLRAPQVAEIIAGHDRSFLLNLVSRVISAGMAEIECSVRT